MIKAKISSVESLGTMDGPGIRYVVFMQGCHLRCQYCHNPETWSENGGKEQLSAKELIERVKKFKPYFGGEGGITFSGGEPLLQPEFLVEALKLCRLERINSAIDTAGVGKGDYEEILSLADLIILDVKATDKEEYKFITGQSMAEFSKFFSLCKKLKKRLWVRQVIVPGINDDFEHMDKLATFLKDTPNIEKVELLPYKTIGVFKYDTLGISYRLAGTPEMDEARCGELEKYLQTKLETNKTMK